MEVVLPKPGKYVVAVSGGVDSVVLLHKLATSPGFELVAAHFDHGIRPDSQRDRKFVQQLAEAYGVPCIYEEGQLGLAANEALARQARYVFLHRVRQEQRAAAIITAHHQDDVLETAIINLLRGTGRKGLSSLSETETVRRPLLTASKKDILTYAGKQGLEWHEDSTNIDQNYLRNYVRHRLLPRFREADKARLRSLINKAHDNNLELDALLAGYLGEQLDRHWLVGLSHDVAMEVMAAWLRSRGVRSFDRRTLERLVIAAKVASPGARFDAVQGVTMRIESSNLALRGLER